MKENSKYAAELFLFFSLLLLVMPRYSHHYDLGWFQEWALFIFHNGITHIYNSNTNYHPIFLYALYVYDLIQGSEEKIIGNLHRIKIFPLLFDFLPALIILLAGSSLNSGRKYIYFLMFNGAYLYNSLIWTQLDSVPSNLSLLAVVLGFSSPAASVAAFVVALNTKLQAIIYLPIILILLASQIRNVRAALKVAATALLTQFIIILPFILSGTVGKMISVVTGAVGYYPLISIEAYNFWHLAAFVDPRHTEDSETWIILSYKHAGLLLFAGSSLLAMLPLGLATVRRWITGEAIDDRYMESAFLACGLIPICFFFFNTQMHERYSHPAMIFFFFYAILSRRFTLYGIVSLAYFLNIEGVLKYFQVSHRFLIFNPKFVAALFLLVLAIGFYDAFKHSRMREDWQFLRGLIRQKALQFR